MDIPPHMIFQASSASKTTLYTEFKYRREKHKDSNSWLGPNHVGVTICCIGGSPLTNIFNTVMYPSTSAHVKLREIRK